MKNFDVTDGNTDLFFKLSNEELNGTTQQLIKEERDDMVTE